MITTETLVQAVEGLRYVRSRMSRSEFFEVFELKHVDGEPLTEYEGRQWTLFQSDLAHWLMRADRQRIAKLTTWIVKEMDA